MKVGSAGEAFFVHKITETKENSMRKQRRKVDELDGEVLGWSEDHSVVQKSADSTNAELTTEIKVTDSNLHAPAAETDPTAVAQLPAGAGAGAGAGAAPARSFWIWSWGSLPTNIPPPPDAVPAPVLPTTVDSVDGTSLPAGGAGPINGSTMLPPASTVPRDIPFPPLVTGAGAAVGGTEIPRPGPASHLSPSPPCDSDEEIPGHIPLDLISPEPALGDLLSRSRSRSRASSCSEDSGRSRSASVTVSTIEEEYTGVPARPEHGRNPSHPTPQSHSGIRTHPTPGHVHTSADATPGFHSSSVSDVSDSEDWAGGGGGGGSRSISVQSRSSSFDSSASVGGVGGGSGTMDSHSHPSHSHSRGRYRYIKSLFPSTRQLSLMRLGVGRNDVCFQLDADPREGLATPAAGSGGGIKHPEKQSPSSPASTTLSAPPTGALSSSSPPCLLRLGLFVWPELHTRIIICNVDGCVLGRRKVIAGSILSSFLLGVVGTGGGGSARAELVPGMCEVLLEEDIVKCYYAVC